MTRMRVLARISAAAAVSLALAGAAASAGKAESKEYVITMQITGFEPAALTVKAGDRITWMNNDLFPHTATADDKAFDSKSLAPAGTWTYVAHKTGAHTYICSFHPTMKATITVQ